MADAGKRKRSAAAKKPAPADRRPRTAPPADAPHRRRTGALLAAAAVVVLAALLAPRLGARLPWSYDEFYHLGLARELSKTFPLRAFPWTPHSVLAERFADKEPLFHLALAPLARLDLETAGLLGVALGQALVVGAVAWFLHRRRAPGAHWILLGLGALGPMVAYRLAMARPHAWHLAGSVLLLGLLAERARPWLLALASALFGLAHTGGWIGIAYALVFAGAGLWLGMREPALLWRPPLAIAGGWLAGQLLHPNLPHNFRLLWLQNAVVPWQATGAGSRDLELVIGAELVRPGAGWVVQQWPAFLPALAAVGMLLRRPALRTQTTLAMAALAGAFLAAGSLLWRRFFEIGAPIGLLAWAAVLAEGSRGSAPVLRRGGRAVAALLLVAGGLWTATAVRRIGATQPRPEGMARWLGAQAADGAQVFTAQWGDSAPLFYFAPRLRSLVALDPTFFYAKDPALFSRYVAIAFGRASNPAAEIRQRFGARYVTVWKAPVFSRLATGLSRDPGAARVFEDPHYQVWELSPAPRP